MSTDYSIRFYRKNKEISQKKLSELLGITRTDLSFIESKKIFPDIELANKIADMLGETIGRFYTKEELDFITYRSTK